MTKSELIEKLLEIDKNNHIVFEQMMEIREQVNSYERNLYKGEQALYSILKEMCGITDLHEELYEEFPFPFFQ